MMKNKLPVSRIIVGLIVGLVLISQPIRAVTTQGMVGYWKLNGNVDDDGGYNHYGKSAGTLVYGTGKSGQCLLLEAKNGYAVIGNHDGRLTISHAVTIEAWINTANPGTGTRYIFAKDESYALAIANGVPAVRGAGGWWKPGGPPLKSSRWYHLAWTYDGSYNRLYIDGKEFASISTFGSLPNGKNITIGHPLHSFDGLIDEVKVYARALSSVEVNCSYYEGLSLAGHWPLDGNARDAGGFGHHGTADDAEYVGSWVGLGLNCREPGPGRTGNRRGVTIDNHDHGLSLSREMTVEAWIRCRELDEDLRYIFNHFGSYGLGIQGGRPAAACAGGWWKPDCEPLKIGKWYHIAAVYNGRWKKLFIDGKEIASAAQKGSLCAGSHIEIGHDTHGFRGIIDEVKVYNRALPAAVIEGNVRDIPVPVGIWSFDGDTMDKSGNGNHGKPINGPRFVRGKINRCLFFDGINDYVLLKNKNASLDVYTIITMEAWIKGTELIDDYMHIYDKYASNTLGVRKGVLSMGGGAGWWSPATTELKPHRWYHVAGTFDSGVRRLYVNGKLMAVQPIKEVSGPGFAAYISHPYFPFHGYIDEVKIYQNTLSTRDIAMRYRAGRRESDAVQHPQTLIPRTNRNNRTSPRHPYD
jgi:hypothetical protein